MRQRTELTDSIVTSKEGQIILDMIAPVYGNDYVTLWLIQAIGTQLDKMGQYADEYKKQLVPQTATWALPIWESEYGIKTNPMLTLEQRRVNVLNKMLSRSAMNPKKLSNIISNLIGADVEIRERTGKNKFTVVISSIPSFIDESAVRKKVDILKPAHLIFDVAYQKAVAGGLYVGGVIQKSKVINLKEV